MFPGRVAVKAAGRSRLTVALNGINSRQAKTGQGRVARAARLGYRRGNRECGTIFAVSNYARASDACFRFKAVTTRWLLTGLDLLLAAAAAAAAAWISSDRQHQLKPLGHGGVPTLCQSRCMLRSVANLRRRMPLPYGNPARGSGPDVTHTPIHTRTHMTTFPSPLSFGHSPL
jgi:hypothetical protein